MNAEESPGGSASQAAPEPWPALGPDAPEAREPLSAEADRPVVPESGGSASPDSDASTPAASTPAAPLTPAADRPPPAPRPFGPARPMAWLGYFAIALMAGNLLLLAGLPLLKLTVFPPIHLAAAILPSLTLTALVAREAGSPAWLTWRGVLGRLAWGGLLAAGLALVAEALALGLIALGVWLWLQATVDGGELLSRLTAALGAAQRGETLDPATARLVLQPPIVLAVFLMFGLIGPIIEELAKLSGVALARPRTAARAWVLGIGVGSGFGLLEALLFGILDLAPGAWMLAMIARACATLMHAYCTALAGRGWFAMGRGAPARGLGGVAAAIGIHGAWNTLMLAAVFAALAAAPGAEGQIGGAALLASGAALALVLLFGAIFFGFLFDAARQGAAIRAEELPAAS